MTNSHKIITDRRHLEELLKAYKNRLRILEQQVAAVGMVNAPPHILADISDVKQKISDVEDDLSGSFPIPILGEETLKVLE